MPAYTSLDIWAAAVPEILRLPPETGMINVNYWFTKEQRGHPNYFSEVIE